MNDTHVQFDQNNSDGEFLWLISFSDLLLLLFVFFVVLFSFTYQKLGAKDFERLAGVIGGSASKSQLDEIQAKLLKWTVDKNLLHSVDVSQKEDSLILQIRERVLFKSGDFELLPQSTEIVAAIGRALGNIPAPYRIGIEGHTDDNPISSAKFRDNWELSSKRAWVVMQALNLPVELKKRTVILSYAEMQPLVPNRNSDGKALPDNQSQNRRVTIRVY